MVLAETAPNSKELPMKPKIDTLTATRAITKLIQREGPLTAQQLLDHLRLVRPEVVDLADIAKLINGLMYAGTLELMPDCERYTTCEQQPS